MEGGRGVEQKKVKVSQCSPFLHYFPQCKSADLTLGETSIDNTRHDDVSYLDSPKVEIRSKSLLFGCAAIFCNFRFISDPGVPRPKLFDRNSAGVQCTVCKAPGAQLSISGCYTWFRNCRTTWRLNAHGRSEIQWCVENPSTSYDIKVGCSAIYPGNRKSYSEAHKTITVG